MTAARHSHQRRTLTHLLTAVIVTVASAIGGLIAYSLWDNHVGIAPTGTSLNAGTFSLTLDSGGWQWTAPGYLAAGQSAVGTYPLVFDGSGANLLTNLVVAPTISPGGIPIATLPDFSWAVVPAGSSPTAADYRTGTATITGIDPGNYVLYAQFTLGSTRALPNGYMYNADLAKSVILTVTAQQTRTAALGDPRA